MGKLLRVVFVFLGRAIKPERHRRPHPFLPLFSRQRRLAPLSSHRSHLALPVLVEHVTMIAIT